MSATSWPSGDLGITLAFAFLIGPYVAFVIGYRTWVHLRGKRDRLRRYRAHH